MDAATSCMMEYLQGVDAVLIVSVLMLLLMAEEKRTQEMI